MGDKQIVISIFDSEMAADIAVDSLKTWEKASDDLKLGAIGVLVMDEKGQLKTHKMGSRSVGKGAGIGLILALLTPVGLVGGIVGGAVLGALHRKGLGLGEADRERISAELAGGKAAVGVLAPAAEAEAIAGKLAASGGRTELHETSDEALREAATEAVTEETPAG